jgi:hypothetical protein
MFRIRLAMFLAVFLTGAALLPAQENQQAALVRSLNNSVLQIHGQLQAAQASWCRLRERLCTAAIGLVRFHLVQIAENAMDLLLCLAQGVTAT